MSKRCARCEAALSLTSPNTYRLAGGWLLCAGCFFRSEDERNRALAVRVPVPASWRERRRVPRRRRRPRRR